MNHGVMRNDAKENIARSIWERKAIMGTDGLVKKSKAIYAFVLSMFNTNVNTNIKDGGFIPPTPHCQTREALPKKQDIAENPTGPVQICCASSGTIGIENGLSRLSLTWAKQSTRLWST
jgi:hypothetical protein